MSERHGAVTFKGKAMTLVGPELRVGAKAPDFTLVAGDLSEKRLADYAGKTLVLITVPSLDTPVCDKEGRTFNERAAALGENVVVLAVSRDLPFAQKRWCGAAGVERLQTLSDYKHQQFGPDYGVLIQELGLLARSVLVIDPSGTIRHCELVKEVTEEPDYEAALEAARTAA